MNRLIEEKHRELEEICRKHHVRRIELFGSGTGRDFDSITSDLHFVVTFQALPAE